MSERVWHRVQESCDCPSCADVKGLARELAAERAEVERLREACMRTNAAVCQSLGKALGYPWFKDDQKNFPGATEADGVCVGEHVAESVAEEAARALKRWEELHGAIRAHDVPDDDDECYYCDFCGTEVTAQDYCVVGHRRAYSCGAAECERYFRDEERGIEEQAMLGRRGGSL